MPIETKLTSKPDKRFIKIKCPNCDTLLERYIPTSQTEGKDKCGICWAEFEWKEIK